MIVDSPDTLMRPAMALVSTRSEIERGPISCEAVSGVRIVGVVPRGELPHAMPVHALPPGAWLAPGWIDLQVNGGGDVLFND